MARSLSPPRPSTVPPPGIPLDDAFDDESGVHDIPLPAAVDSQIPTEPPPSSDEIRQVLFNGLPTLEPAEASTQPPAVRAQLPTLRDESSTSPAPAGVVAQLCKASGEHVTQPAPDSDAAVELYTDMEQSGALRAASIPTSRPAANEPPPLANLELAAARMKDCFGEGDYQACLETAEQILARNPNDEGAGSYARTCRRLIEQRHAERIGDLSAIPVVAVSQEQMRWLALDHREGFLLSLIDGHTSIEDLCDIAGMSRVDVLKTIAGLIDAEVLRLDA
ncbi:MAG: hypothetical protein HY898_07830 [Deltaproteobacteria bacterium]|nr:hypothetical protein [Deltaproteobacteria bacterium]